MPAIFVHGNPEHPDLWTPLLSHLSRSDVDCPRLPGFGEPAPAGFGATKEEYVDWLIGVLEAVGEPVDLVGHDWGGGFTLRVVCLRPDLLRSWVSDAAGLLDPDYVWHDLAQIWQAPGDGEAYFEGVLSQPPEVVAPLYEGAGVTPRRGRCCSREAADEEMARCVLALYRSAIQPAMLEWTKDAEKAAARPGLVVVAAEDPYTGGTAGLFKMAKALGAKTVELAGVGHWWMLQDPAAGARAIEEFWASA